MARKRSSNPTPNPTPALFPGLSDAPRARALPPGTMPLFLTKLIQEAARHTQMEAHASRRRDAHAVFRAWIAALEAGALARQKETEGELDFVGKLLRALGYQSVSDILPGQPWTLSRQHHVPGQGLVDVALGRFGPDPDDPPAPRVLVELKGPEADLDRRGSRHESAVEQAWRYLTATETGRWAIVSNYVEVRLYSRSRTSNHVYRVDLADLADPAAFDQFYAVFCAASLLGENELVYNADRLERDTVAAQESVTETFYAAYSEQRPALIHAIRAARPDLALDPAIEAAQKLLDRILFVAFAEDRGILPDRNLIEKTADTRIPGMTRWNAFQFLFDALNLGDPSTGIPRLNGELFKPDPVLDDRAFKLPDDRWPRFFKSIGGYDFKDEVPPDILGRVFERSITDLEEIKARGLDAHEQALRSRAVRGRRRREGVFYTNRNIVGYLVAAALDPAWEADRLTRLAAHNLDADLPDGDPPPPSPAHAAYLRERLAFLDNLTLCDPACGSGAFLLAAYDWFEARRDALLSDLHAADPHAPECDGGRPAWIERSAPLILAHNLHGADLSPEAVEIAKLSLWIRTARPGQPLTSLAANVVCGNSVVADPAIDPRALDWRARFPAVFDRGGFDAVVGNPPYVRQELLGAAAKGHFETAYRAYHGMADLYVYFYERGLELLRPGGRLAYVVTNKWMKAGYGEALRALLAGSSWVEQVVDFGHAKQFFPDADVFPCFLVLRRPADDQAPPDQARVCVIPRELADLERLPALVAGQGLGVERDRFTASSWNLEPKAVGDLMRKIRDRGVPLAEYAGCKPLMGIKTGCNEAFLIDTPTRDALIAKDPRSSEIIKPYLRGQDIERWHADWAGMWMIAMKSSGDHPWPWADRGDEAEAVFAAAYPSLHEHFQRYEPALKKRQDHGRYWWELRSCAYWAEFESAKILYTDITWKASFCVDRDGSFSNNTTYFVGKADSWMLAALNSSLGWWFSWRAAQHGKDEALRLFTSFVESYPIAKASDSTWKNASPLVDGLIDTHRANLTDGRRILDWLRHQFDIESPSMKLRDPIRLTSDELIAEVRAAWGKKKTLSAAAQAELRREYAQTIEPARTRAAEAARLERDLHDIVNAAYGLTPDEVKLMWDTAPPRMPIPRPPGV